MFDTLFTSHDFFFNLNLVKQLSAGSARLCLALPDPNMLQRIQDLPIVHDPFRKHFVLFPVFKPLSHYWIK